MGARERCASLTILTMRASSVSAPTRSAFRTNAPVPFTVPPVARLPGAFSTGMGSPVIIDSSTKLDPSDHHAVHRNAFARPHSQQVAGMHVVERHVLFRSVRSQAAAQSRAPV